MVESWEDRMTACIQICMPNKSKHFHEQHKMHEWGQSNCVLLKQMINQVSSDTNTLINF